MDKIKYRTLETLADYCVQYTVESCKVFYKNARKT